MIRILLERLCDNGGTAILDHIRLSTMTVTVILGRIDEGGDFTEKLNRKYMVSM